MKYQNVKDYLLNEITTNSLNSGDKLPSIRQLSIQFSYSKSTVIKSLEELEKEHLIYSVPQKGFFVTEQNISTTPKSKKSIFYRLVPIYHLLVLKIYHIVPIKSSPIISAKSFHTEYQKEC